MGNGADIKKLRCEKTQMRGADVWRQIQGADVWRQKYKPLSPFSPGALPGGNKPLLWRTYKRLFILKNVCGTDIFTIQAFYF